MFPPNKSSRDLDGADAPARGTLTFTRLCIILALALTAAALTCLYAHNNPSPTLDAHAEPPMPFAYFASTSFVQRPGTQRSAQPRTTPTPQNRQSSRPFLIPIPSSISLCPGKSKRTTIVILTGGKYTWAVSGGRIISQGAASIVWDLSVGTPDTTYTVTATRVDERRSSPPVQGTTSVEVHGCSGPPSPPPPTAETIPTPQCPNISVSCPQSVTAGESLSCTATLEGGVPGKRQSRAKLSNPWSISTNNGILTPLSWDSNTVEVSTTGLDNQRIIVTYKINWYGLNCSASGSTDVSAKPTPSPPPMPIPPPTPPPASNSHDREIVVTVSPTVTPPNQSPTATSSPSLSPSPTPSESPSPSSTPSASPSPSPIPLVTVSASATPIIPPTPPDGNERFLHALLVFAFIAALAAVALLLVLLILAMKNYGGLAYMKSVIQSFVEVNTTDQKEAAGGGQILGGLIIGGQKRKSDEVHCTAFAPHYAAPGDSFLVQVFAHLASQVSQLAALAQAADTDAMQRDSVELDERIERGQELFFELKMDNLSVQEPTTMRLVWNGEPKSVKFDVRVPADCHPMSTTGTVDIIYLGVPIGRLRFKLKITPGWKLGEAAAKQIAQEQNFFRYNRAFISYASQDRAEVLKRVQMLKELKIEYFQDILSLDPGDRWEQQLYKKIDESDVFFLFWSTAASKSKWVEEEVIYALEHKHGEAGDAPVIKPVIIEGPPPAPPPPRLQSLHFNDKLMYLIWGEEIMNRERQQGTPSTPRVKESRW